jgi:hypothetical protein
MFFNKKGGIELSINAIITIIMSLVILGLGLGLLMNFISGSDEIKFQMDQQTEQQIENLLTQKGQKVAFPFHKVEITRSNSKVVGLGIMNILRENKEFEIIIELSGGLDDNNQPLKDNIDFLYQKDVFLNENENKKIPISVDVPKDASNGEYIYNIRVSTNGEIYGNLQKLYVTVKS